MDSNICADHVCRCLNRHGCTWACILEPKIPWATMLAPCLKANMHWATTLRCTHTYIYIYIERLYTYCYIKNITKYKYAFIVYTISHPIGWRIFNKLYNGPYVLKGEVVPAALRSIEFMNCRHHEDRMSPCGRGSNRDASMINTCMLHIIGTHVRTCQHLHWRPGSVRIGIYVLSPSRSPANVSTGSQGQHESV